jgi:hypothetical protein
MPRTSLLNVIAMLLAPWLPAAEVPVELSNVDRHIGKQPKYVADQPLYGLVLFGPKKAPVWIVLDKSAPSQTKYDVAYVDLNANRDLTDQGERITTMGEADDASRFILPDFVDPATGETHTEFTLRYAHQEDAYQMVSVKWRGKQKFGGGYTANPDKETYSRFAHSPNNAPILWLNGDGPFTFQRWYTEPLNIGGETDVKLFIGVPGLGTSTFCAFQIHALPEGEGIEGILHYSTTGGEQRQSTFALMNKC